MVRLTLVFCWLRILFPHLRFCFFGLFFYVCIINASVILVICFFLCMLLFMGWAALGATHLFGLTPTEGIIAALALLFSSTIVVIKSLSDKREQSRLYGQIAVGVLLVEDIIATLALLFVAAGDNGTSDDLTRLLLNGIADRKSVV